MTTARGSQAGFIVVAKDIAATRTSQAGFAAIANVRGESVRTSQAALSVIGEAAEAMRTSQAGLIVIARGRVATPNLRAWTFTLDGHPFYMLHLGDFKTIVYDVSTEQWVDWRSINLDFWRANVGQNWLGATKVATVFGSNILVGDDLFGLLWFLDPTFGEDQSPAEDRDNEHFPRIVMGQIPMRGRDFAPCYEVFLTTDKGDPAYDFAPVTLYTSDDGGVNFDEHTTIQLIAGDVTQELSWPSLGQIAAPGRLFRIEDDGAIARIDSLDMSK